MSDIEREPASGIAQRPGSPLGSLGMALVGVQARAQAITLVATGVLAVVAVATLLPALAGPLGERFGFAPALWILGVLAWAIFVLAIAAIAIVPPLLLPKRDRAVFATHSWIGAREVRRAFGGAARAIDLPRDAETANAWLARTPASDRNRFVRVDAFMLAGRFDDARTEAGLLPDRTPLDAYRKQEALALIADQTGGAVDEEDLQGRIAAMPPGTDRIEATASLAVFRARRALPDGDWRAPLLDARSAIPGSDARVLLADFGLPMFEILARKAVVPFTALLILIAASLTVLPALTG